MELGTVFESITDRFMRPRDPARLLGRCLAWDGLTKAGLEQTLAGWRRAGSTPPSLLDLVFLSPNEGICTRMLVGGAVTGRFEDDALEYRDEIAAKLLGSLAGVTAAIHRDTTGLWTVKIASCQGEVAKYAYDHLLTAQPDAFAAARRAFETELPAADVLYALRTGACERMDDVFASRSPAERWRLEEDARPLTETGQAASEILDQIFPIEADRIREGIRRELLRFRHARIFTAPFNPMGPSLWQLPVDRVAARRARYAAHIGRTLGDAERGRIVDLAFSPADDALFSSIVFPR